MRYRAWRETSLNVMQMEIILDPHNLPAVLTEGAWALLQGEDIGFKVALLNKYGDALTTATIPYGHNAISFHWSEGHPSDSWIPTQLRIENETFYLMEDK